MLHFSIDHAALLPSHISAPLGRVMSFQGLRISHITVPFIPYPFTFYSHISAPLGRVMSFQGLRISYITVPFIPYPFTFHPILLYLSSHIPSPFTPYLCTYRRKNPYGGSTYSRTKLLKLLKLIKRRPAHHFLFRSLFYASHERQKEGR